MSRPLHALTLWPEWAWAFAHLDKRTENRSRPPDRRLQPGDWLAIHAGAHVGGRPVRRAKVDALVRVSLQAWEAGWAANSTAAPGIPLSKGSEFGVFDPDSITTRHIVGLARYTGCDQDQRTGWDVPGQWHWRSDAWVPVLVPVEKGAQGLWRVQGEALERCRDALGKVTT